VKKMDDKTLYKIASEASEAAYAPFSGFKVGAALLTGSGEIYTGANVENSSYGATICAERAAAVKAVNAGEREFVAIAIAAPARGGLAWPCGTCRQFLFEFGGELYVTTGKDLDNLETIPLKELLPHGFKIDGTGDER